MDNEFSMGQRGWVALLAAIFLSPYFYIFQIANIGTYGIQLVDVLLLLFYGILCFKIFTSGVQFFLLRHPLSVVFCLPFLVVSLSFITPIYIWGKGDQFFKTYFHFLYYYVFFLLIVFWDQRQSFTSSLIRIWLIIGILIGLYGLYQIPARAMGWPLAWIPVTNISVFASRTPDVSRLQEISEQLSLQFSNFFRVTSIFSEPSVLGRLCATLLVFLLIPFVQKERPFLPPFWSGIAIIIFILAIMGSFSLTGVGALFILILAIFLFEGWKKAKSFFLYLLLFACVVLIAAKIMTPIVHIDILDLYKERIARILGWGTNPYVSHISGESVSTRLHGIIVSFDVWSSYPLFGVGAGHFYLADAAQKDGVIFSSTLYTAVLAETGTIGLFLFLIFFFTIFILSIQLYTDRHLIQNDQLRRLAGVVPYHMILYLFFNLSSTAYVSFWIDLIIICRILVEVLHKEYCVQAIPVAVTIPRICDVVQFRLWRR